MNVQDMVQRHQEICDKAREVMEKKNHDYAAPSERRADPLAIFANFRQCEFLNICSVESGMLVRLSDKFSRICNLLREGHQRSIKDEAVTDTIQDAINYLILLQLYLEASKEVSGDLT